MNEYVKNILTKPELKIAVAATALGISLSEGTHFFSSKIQKMLATTSLTQKKEPASKAKKIENRPSAPTVHTTLVEKNEKNESVRGLWIDRYSWKSKEDLNTLVMKAKNSGINTLYFQVRGDGGGDSAYPSCIEENKYRYGVAKIDPVTKERIGTNFFIRWDPLEYLTTLAHKNNIKVEAWVNVYTTNRRFISQNRDRKHWVLKGDEGSSDNYLWLNPENPQVRMYLNEVVREIAIAYKVDAIHLDRIRVPQKNFATPMAREAITSHVKELNTIVHEEGKKLTAAIFGYQTGKSEWGLAGGGSNERFAQDGARWIENDCMETGPCVDTAVLMFYWALIHTPKQRSFPEPVLSEVLDQYKEKSRLVLGLQTAPKADPKKTVPVMDIKKEMEIGKKELGGFALYDYEKNTPIIPE